MTLGARGGLVAMSEGVRRVAPVKVQAIDTTGAGDAFIGSFARYFAAGLGLDAALAQATRYAADSSPSAARKSRSRRKPSSRRSARSLLESGAARSLPGKLGRGARRFAYFRAPWLTDRSKSQRAEDGSARPGNASLVMKRFPLIRSGG